MPDPEGAYELLQRSTALLAGRHAAQAAVVLARAAAVEPGKGSILEPLGRALFMSGQLARAVETFEALLEIDPSNAYAHYRWAGPSSGSGGEPRPPRTSGWRSPWNRTAASTGAAWPASGRKAAEAGRPPPPRGQVPRRRPSQRIASSVFASRTSPLSAAARASPRGSRTSSSASSASGASRPGPAATRSVAR